MESKKKRRKKAERKKRLSRRPIKTILNIYEHEKRDELIMKSLKCVIKYYVVS